MPGFDPPNSMGYHRNYIKYSSRSCWHHKDDGSGNTNEIACYRLHRPKSLRSLGKGDRLMLRGSVDSSLRFDFLGEIFQKYEINTPKARWHFHEDIFPTIQIMIYSITISK